MISAGSGVRELASLSGPGPWGDPSPECESPPGNLVAGSLWVRLRMKGTLGVSPLLLASPGN